MVPLQKAASRLLANFSATDLCFGSSPTNWEVHIMSHHDCNAVDWDVTFQLKQITLIKLYAISTIYLFFLFG